MTLAATLCAAALTACLGAGPAGAVVAKVAGHVYGLTPIRGVNPSALPAVQRALTASGHSSAAPLPYDKANQLTYHGGAVMHSVNTHVIYWDPSGEFTVTTKGIVNKFFTDVAHDSGLGTNVFGVAGQYGDGTGHAVYSSTYEGEATDATAYPASGCTIPNEFDKSAFYAHCITDEQLQTELSAYLAAHSGLPKGSAQQYFVLFPHNVVTCLEPGVCSNNFYCAYHSSIEGGTSNEVIYSDIPFSLLDSVAHAKACQSDGHAEVQHPNGDNTGGEETTKYADIALKYMSHEYIEASTDPVEGGGWWEDLHGQEIGDKCNFVGGGSALGEDPNAFLPTLGGSTSPTLFNQLINEQHFYLQSEWDNAGKACLMKPAPLSAASFTASPTAGITGGRMKFSGVATDAYGGLAFSWKFGDGTESAGAAPEHVYGAPGNYEVTMTPKDEFTFATAAPVVHTITVSDPVPVTPPPPPTPPAPTIPSVVTTTSTIAEVTAPNSSFTPGETAFNQKTGELTFTQTVGDPGTLRWLLTFQNGKFGVFTASSQKCKPGSVSLGGKCRPSKIVFARGSRVVAAPGAVTFKLKPSASGLKALKSALKKKKGLPLTVTFTFQSSRGGSPVTRTRTLTVKLKGH